MKSKIDKLLSWFEEHFNFYIELLAFLGGIFCIVFSIVLFTMLAIDAESVNELRIEIILLPGLIAFFGVVILFALRITRFLTKN